MTVQIAPATASDFTTVTELLGAQLQEHSIPLAPERLADAVRGALADDGRALVLLARQGQQTVGVTYLSFQWTLERGGAVMWLEELYVVPDHRGKRIGQRLLEAALDVGRSRSCNSVELEVESSHARAANLYARAGFHALDRIHWTLPLR
jgi:GNAT superfamily N-acetyltransferase